MGASMRPYVIRKGDCLTRLAHSKGFCAEDVWHHPENESLRNKRPDMDMLAPGDIVKIPDESELQASELVPGETNVYSARAETFTIRIVLCEVGQPLGGVKWEVHSEKQIAFGTTEADGIVEFDVPLQCRTVDLHLPEQDDIYPLVIGGLDPTDVMSGARSRLRNLGFDPGPVDRKAGPKGSSQFRAALKAFQQAYGASTTGELDEETIAALIRVHGC
jgi:hypothetical protein